MGPLLVLIAAAIWQASASPTIYPNLDILRVKQGDSVELLCSGNFPVVWIGIQNGSNMMVYDNGTLYMPKASGNQMGNYQCAYINKPEEGIRTIYVAVTDNHQPLTVTIGGGVEHVRLQGEPFNISCRVQYHSYEYNGKWIYPLTANASLNSMDLDTGLSQSYASDYNLFIPAVQLQDSGIYTCLGEAAQLHVNVSVTLQVLEKGYLRLSRLQNRIQEINLHQNLNLQVFIDAYPRPSTYRWMHVNTSGRSILTGHMIFGHQRHNNTLSLNWMEEKDVGAYIFFADNGEASASIHFHVFMKKSASPTIYPNLDILRVKQGDSVELLCSGNFPVEWIGIQNGSTAMVYGNGTLYMPNVSCKQMGSYHCAYINKPEEGIRTIYVAVTDPESMWCGLSDVYPSVEKGMDALIPCLIADPGFTGNMTLLKDSSPVHSGISFSPKEGIWIHKVDMSDVGSYECKAQVQGKWVISRRITLSVYDNHLTVTIGGVADHVRLQGEPFNISCRVQYPSHEYNGKWIYPLTANASLNEKEFDTGLSQSYASDYSLFIPAVQLQNSGIYTCLGEAAQLHVNVSVTLQVLEKGYLHLSTLQNRIEETNMHQNLNLQVFIDAYPRPSTYRWIHVNPSGNSTESGDMSLGNHRYNNTLRLNWMEEKDSGEYIFFADNEEANASIHFYVSVKTKPKITKLTNLSSRLQCEVTGYPPPHIQWYKFPPHTDRCGQYGALILNDSRLEIMSEIPFVRVSLKSVLKVKMEDSETICCFAVNSAGNDSSFIKFSVGSKDENSKLLYAGFGGTMGFLLLCIIFLVYKYKQKPKYQVHWKIIEACEGNNYTFIDPTQLPYNEKWEFPRNNLQFGKVLGAGAFGKVIEATAFGLGKEDSVLKVAVKMLKSTAHTDEQEALMSELKIMSHLGHHENIVNLLGACTHGGPVLVITEYCPFGDLLNFLREKAEHLIIEGLTLECTLDSMMADYKNIYLGKKYVQRSDSGLGCQSVDSYLEMKSVISSVPMPPQGTNLVSTEGKEDLRSLDLFDLLQFSNQVAQGMTFLASKNCIHRDLAARNVLVADGLVAKICDFGLARDIVNDSNYVVKGNARLPVKWMAPESIFECVYTVQSDVWSYGILLWEIFSLGRSPYPGVKVNNKFYNLVKQGYHMGKPDFAPDDMYNIMTACWKLEPTQRPTFSQICTLIQNQLDAIKEQDYKNLPCPREEEDSGCEPASYFEESCESGEVEQPLLNSNNYQFC
ncbi:macrophage colony-stimulating factor 1 receptor isoform X2 [Ahaetulla prasina]|uniref:macrophage colony-stimulating factor 1 receptor isoform X2 n=1 Tax=Ahaetulla prasina TaxID=499056 RepID=UPI002647B572|nr:macrophage colony-stimulating factor 1 receptor isoform X2 [Ahaetulla prasina]